MDVNANALCVSDAVLNISQSQVRRYAFQQARHYFQSVGDAQIRGSADEDGGQGLTDGVSEGLVVLVVVRQHCSVDFGEDLSSVYDQVVSDMEHEGHGVLEGREGGFDLGQVHSVSSLAGLNG